VNRFYLTAGLRCGTFHLFARNRPDVRDIPPDARERFYDSNDHDHQKRQMHERRDDCPEKYEDTTDTRDCAKHGMHHCRDNVKQKPRAAEDDRLHCVKTHKAIALFENIKNDAAD